MDIGLLFNTDRMTGTALIEYAQRAERTGLDCIWLPELFGREPFVTAAALLSATRSIRVASGIANVGYPMLLEECHRVVAKACVKTGELALCRRVGA